MNIDNDWCDPAASIIQKLGGLAAVANGIDVPRATVQRWQRPRNRGGTGGVIPHWHLAAIMDLAKNKGVTLSPGDFLRFDRSDAA